MTASSASESNTLTLAYMPLMIRSSGWSSLMVISRVRVAVFSVAAIFVMVAGNVSPG